MIKVKKILNSATARAIIVTSIFRFLSIQALFDRRFLVSETKFLLYTRPHPNKYVELTLEDLITNNTKYLSHFRNKKWIILTHGWMADGFTSSTQVVKNAYLHAKDVNVIIVDWTKAASFVNYITSAYLTDAVAKKIKDFLLAISLAWDLDGSNMHLIGHSLGAHVMGLTGKQLKDNKFKIARVTGIDPARHFFEWPEYFPGITKESGTFVDIIHTSRGAIGYHGTAGHVDFYPNGGLRHPHCCYAGNILGMSCEHSCAYIYYSETILGSNYTSYKCDSYESFQLGRCQSNDIQYMGEPCSPTASGTYYVNIT